MDVSNLRNYEKPTIQPGTFEIKCVAGKDLTGKEADENGEKSLGLGLRYEIVGPDDAILSSGAPAKGLQFDDNLWMPRQSTTQKGRDIMNAKLHARLVATFGVAIPDDVQGADFEGRSIMAVLTPKFDDFKGEKVPSISRCFAIGEQ